MLLARCPVALFREGQVPTVAVIAVVLATMLPGLSLAASDARPPLAERLRDDASPTDQLRGHIQALLAVLRDPTLKPAEHAERREAAVRKALLAGFDVSETARRVTSATPGLTPQERVESTRLLTETLSAVVSRFAVSLLGASLAERHGEAGVTYLRESVDGNDGVVHAVVLGKGYIDIPVTASMIRRGARWLVYDLRVEEVSLVENYRAQCEAILRRSSYPGLLERLRSKRDLVAADLELR
jgi:phospholipid transport system substrate-binding protein